MRSSIVRKPKKIIKSLVGATGFTIRRVPNPNRLLKGGRETGGFVVEFIGASGIGKSTLCDALYATCSGRWFSKDELDDLILGDLDYPTELQEILKDLLLARTKRVHSFSKDLFVMANKMQYANKTALKEVLMRRIAARGFMLDEGTLQVFGSEICELPASKLRVLFGRRAVILLDTRDAELLAERYMKRHGQRLSRGKFQHPKSADRISSSAHQVLDSHRRVYELAIENACLGLHLYAEDGFEQNLSDLKAFEAKVRERSRSAR